MKEGKGEREVREGNEKGREGGKVEIRREEGTEGSREGKGNRVGRREDGIEKAEKR